MSLTEIFNDSLKYPFSDMTKFCIIGIVMVVSSLGSLEIGNAIISSVLGIVAAVASIITSGYSVSVVKKAIVKSDEIPDLDLRENIIDGLKMIVMLIVYYIIPIIITLIGSVLKLSNFFLFFIISFYGLF